RLAVLGPAKDLTLSRRELRDVRAVGLKLKDAAVGLVEVRPDDGQDPTVSLALVARHAGDGEHRPERGRHPGAAEADPVGKPETLRGREKVRAPLATGGRRGLVPPEHPLAGVRVHEDRIDAVKALARVEIGPFFAVAVVDVVRERDLALADR